MTEAEAEAEPAKAAGECRHEAPRRDKRERVSALCVYASERLIIFRTSFINVRAANR